MQHQFPRQDETTVRPAFRALGALALCVVALAMAASTYQLLIARAPAFRPNTCSGKGRVLCELGNWLSDMIPDPIQIPLEIASGIALTLLPLYVATRLVFRRGSAASPENVQ